MFSFLYKNSWPSIEKDDMIKRSTILVIDDQEFYYQKLFINDGYHIEKWSDVDDINKLEAGYYDIILLDIQGIGKELAQDQGLGILKHLKRVCPTQLIIAYSNSDFSLKYQEFFELADAKLSKDQDYIIFKEKVDNLLMLRYSKQYYITKILKLCNDHVVDKKKLDKMINKTLVKNNIEYLKGYLGGIIDDKDALDLIMIVMKNMMKLKGAIWNLK